MKVILFLLIGSLTVLTSMFIGYVSIYLLSDYIERRRIISLIGSLIMFTLLGLIIFTVETNGAEIINSLFTFLEL